MSAVLQKLRSAPLGTLLLLAIAAGLYVAMLANTVPPTGGGEALIGQAYAGLFLTFWLWVVLALLLLAGGMMGEMPRWVAISAIFLHPLSGVAAFVAMDAYSRHVNAAILMLVLSPPLIAGYAVWARLVQLHQAFPARAVSLPAWSAIFLLSIASLLLAM